MRGKRSSLGVIGVLDMLMAFLAVSPAQADAGAVADDSTGVQILTAPPAPEGAELAAEVGAALVTPTISPTAPFVHLNPGDTYFCAVGNLCTWVFDPTVKKWKVFALYACHEYKLSNWLNIGYDMNRQTGNATAHFYDKNGRTIISRKPSGERNVTSWSPIWSIRNC